MSEAITKDQMKLWLETASKERLANALVQLFERQTDSEQATDSTTDHNKVGFNSCDAQILSSIAKWHMAKGWISPKQADLVRKCIKKYSGQLADIANTMKGVENVDGKIKNT